MHPLYFSLFLPVSRFTLTRGSSETERGTCGGSELQRAYPRFEREERAWALRVRIGEGATT